MHMMIDHDDDDGIPIESIRRRRAEESAELARRTAIVRAAKDRCRRRELPMEVLDAILPDTVPARRRRAAR